ncbi:MAG: hypothetical protein A07HB70_01133 [uncultured archaeon A07HB70]|nr:MAG: hypothetical protein A07HB70_01133 [uncultured archaeon A07HB70]
MTDTAEVRVWLVDREYTEKGMLTLAYATTAGDRVWRRQLSAAGLPGDGVAAARTVDPERLTTVEDPDDRARYASEAARVAERNDPESRI